MQLKSIAGPLKSFAAGMLAGSAVAFAVYGIVTALRSQPTGPASHVTYFTPVPSPIRTQLPQVPGDGISPTTFNLPTPDRVVTRAKLCSAPSRLRRGRLALPGGTAPEC